MEIYRVRPGTPGVLTRKQKLLRQKGREIRLRRLVLYAGCFVLCAAMLAKDLDDIEAGKWSYVQHALARLVMLFAFFVFDVNYTLPYIRYCMS